MAAIRTWAASLVLSAGAVAGAGEEARCPGRFMLEGLGNVSLVPTGWGADVPSPVMRRGGVIETTMGSRSYFATTCTAGKYDNEQYLALDFRGKTLTYTVDMSSAGCGCNAALYLTNMRQNERVSDCGDYYCDANSVCGEACAEIDIQEGNMYAWHSTLHSAMDHTGLGKGYGGGGEGWSGPRDYKAQDYGPHARCVDTTLPFQVSAYFPVDEWGRSTGMEITLTQHGKDCPLWMRIDGYSDMGALDQALAQGMTPIVSYWSSEDMTWMDGKGEDGKGPCAEDVPEDCGASVRFYDFAVQPNFPALATTPRPTTTTEPSVVVLLPAEPGSKGGSPPVEPGTARAFFAGVLALLGAQVVCALLVWGVRSASRNRNLQRSACPVGTSGILESLAEIGGAEPTTVLSPRSESRSVQVLSPPRR